MKLIIATNNFPKTIKTRRKVLTALQKSQSAVAHFEVEMLWSCNSKVDPSSCIPLTNSRILSESGMLSLMFIFYGIFHCSGNYGTAGIALGTAFVTVVAFKGSV